MDYHFFIIVLVVFVLLVLISKLVDDKLFIMLGGIILLCIGLYVVLNGLPVVDSDGLVMTEFSGLWLDMVWMVLVGVGGYLVVKTGMKMIEEGL